MHPMLAGVVDRADARRDPSDGIGEDERRSYREGDDDCVALVESHVIFVSSVTTACFTTAPGRLDRGRRPGRALVPPTEPQRSSPRRRDCAAPARLATRSSPSL